MVESKPAHVVLPSGDEQSPCFLNEGFSGQDETTPSVCSVCIDCGANFNLRIHNNDVIDVEL